jgi:hypothetical protein
LLIKEQILFRLSCYNRFATKLVVNMLDKAGNNRIKLLNISSVICKIVVNVGVANLVF